MDTIEMEYQKTALAQEILGETDEVLIKELWTLLKNRKSTNKKRHIGILEGKVFFKEESNGKITMEEFLGL